jgi:alpha-tubulin suppressor-like RCC1 family protein
MPVAWMRASKLGRQRGARPAAAISGAAVALVAGMAGPAAAAPRAEAAVAVSPALAPPSPFGWGNEGLGELGNGVSGPVLTGPPVYLTLPQPVALPGTVRQLALSGFCGAAVLAGGTVATWGYNLDGELGDSTFSSRPIPAVISGLTGITQLANGDFHMLARDAGGRVWAWGDNQYGQQGDSLAGGTYPTPGQVPGITDAVQVAAGTGTSYALRSNGTVLAWGDNRHGELGDGTSVSQSRPEPVPGLTGITKVFAGDQDAFAVRADGSVLAWGDNTGGQLGTGSSAPYLAVPAAVPGLTGVTQIATTAGFGLALAGPSGTVWGWGVNLGGQLGDGTTTSRAVPEATGLSGVTQVAVGSSATGAAVLASGSLLTWGSNGYGELGTGTVDNSPHPVPKLVPTLAGVSQVSGGFNDVMAIGSPAPRIPSVIGDTQAEATQEIQAAGYVLGRVAVVLDITCEYIGEVKSQSPAAGTPGPPGTTVSLAIGKAGGKCL